MDGPISAGQAARRLHTSVPRVIRAIARLGLDLERGPGGRVSLDEADWHALQADLGVVPKVADLSRTQARVLAALARAPLGLVSARAVASRAGVSPTAAGSALRGLLGRGLIREECRPVAAGRAQELRIFRTDPTASAWAQLAPALGEVLLPSASAVPSGRSVPPRLRHLFWNVAPGQLAIDEQGEFIARRLLQSADLEGLAWAAARLSSEDWEHAAATRGLDPGRVALARNLTAAALPGAGSFAVTGRAPGTLNGLFSQTRLQVLHADEVEPQHRLEPTLNVAGIEVAGSADIMAMKLKVLPDRGELRDYFDLMAIERELGRTVEEGLALFLERYRRPPEPYVIEPIVRALGYLDDVDEDESLPASKAEIEAYWRERQPEIIRNCARFGP